MTRHTQTTSSKASARTAKAPKMPMSSASDEVSEAPQASMPFDREQAIREAAYACFEARGCVPGHELDDWLQAEAQVLQANGHSASDSGVEQTTH